MRWGLQTYLRLGERGANSVPPLEKYRHACETISGGRSCRFSDRSRHPARLGRCNLGVQPLDFWPVPVVSLLQMVASAPMPARAPPAGATAMCKDYSYSMSKTASGRCSSHG